MPETQEKRNRAPNYTYEEKSILFEIIEDFLDIIENKKTDVKTCRSKDETWDRVTKIFNFRSKENIHRNKESLKKMYDNSKKNIRKQIEEGRISLKGIPSEALEIENKCKNILLYQCNEDLQSSDKNIFIKKSPSSCHEEDLKYMDGFELNCPTLEDNEACSGDEEICTPTAALNEFRTATTTLTSKRNKLADDNSELGKLKIKLYEQESESMKRRIAMEEELHELKKRKLLLEIRKAELELQKLKES